jgi:hypothetical protein
VSAANALWKHHTFFGTFSVRMLPSHLETDMNDTGKNKLQPNTGVKEGHAPLEELAKKVDPPGREVSDDELKDPGRMTTGAPPVDNRS